MRSVLSKRWPRRRYPYRLAAAATVLTLASVIGFSAIAYGTQTVSDDLIRAVDAYDRATVANDTTALTAIVSDDYMLVNSDASVQDKNSYLADFAVPGFKIEPYEMEHPFLRAHGDAALTGGTFAVRWTQDGQRQMRRLRASHFWVRQHGRWRLAYTQLTRVPN